MVLTMFEKCQHANEGFFWGGGNFLIFSAALMETIVTKGDVEQKWKSYNLHKKNKRKVTNP